MHESPDATPLSRGDRIAWAVLVAAMGALLAAIALRAFT